jgi:nitrogen fixation protein FixH
MSSAWIPWVFAGGFGLVVAANGALVWLASSTFNGLVTENAYQEGLAYNRTLDEAEHQARLAWSIAPAFASEGSLVGRLDLEASTALGPLIGANALARLVRPTQARHDFDVVLSPSAAGRYGARIVFPLPGVWDAHITLERDGRSFNLVRRLFVR